MRIAAQSWKPPSHPSGFAKIPVMDSDSILEHIDAVDAFARTLFVRAQRSSWSRLAAAADLVGHLHIALRHLRVEAADSDSLLKTRYARSTHPLVRDCNDALGELQALLGENEARDRRDAGRLAAVLARLDKQHAAVEAFLDTVQLPPRSSCPQGNESSLEAIKDKVDDVATRLFDKRRARQADGDDEDMLWRDFKTELEREGFMPRVLHQHKEVLRAYIRELEYWSGVNGGGAPPSVRGLLSNASRSPSPPPRPPKEPIAHDRSRPSARRDSIRPQDAPPPPPAATQDAGSADGDGMTCISTRHLMDLDSLNAGMGRLQVASDKTPGIGASPTSPQSFPPPDFASMFPRHGHHGARSVRPSANQRAMSHLAPDRYGNKIALNAQWTKISRELVSLEALERSGMRYEARPEFVAVLGRLSRTDMAELVRQSAACRAARLDSSSPSSKQSERQPPRRSRAHSMSSYSSDDSYNSTSSDRQAGKQDKVPYIVNPPDKAPSSSTVIPKPILKNRNENRVRFDPEPHEIDPRSSRERQPRESGRQRRQINSSGSGSSNAPGSKDHEQQNHHTRRHEHQQSLTHRRDRDKPRGDQGDTHRQQARERRTERGKKRWGETIGAVGIGGAAASLLGVLVEAAGTM